MAPRAVDKQQVAILTERVMDVLLASGAKAPEIYGTSAEVLARVQTAMLRSTETQQQFDSLKEGLKAVLTELQRMLDEEWFTGGKAVAVA